MLFWSFCGREQKLIESRKGLGEDQTVQRERESGVRRSQCLLDKEDLVVFLLAVFPS